MGARSSEHPPFIRPPGDADCREATPAEVAAAETWWREKLTRWLELDGERAWWDRQIAEVAAYVLTLAAEADPGRMTVADRCHSLGLIKLAVKGRGHIDDSEIDAAAFRRLADERAEAHSQADSGELWFAGTVAVLIWESQVEHSPDAPLHGITDDEIHTLAVATLEAFGLAGMGLRPIEASEAA